MTKILLSCDSGLFDIALDLKFIIQDTMGFKVVLNLDDWKKDIPEYEKPIAKDLETQLDGAAALVVFKLDESKISAWVIMEETDKICKHDSQMRESILLPECIDISDDFSCGIDAFKSTLESGYGIMAKDGGR